MVIWVFDYCNANVIKMDVLPKTREEIFNDYGENVEDYLYDHEHELGIRMKDCSYMVVSEEREHYTNIDI